MIQLPSELKYYILSYLSIDSISNFCYTNKQNFKLLDNEYFWQVKIINDFQIDINDLTYYLNKLDINLYYNLNRCLQPLTIEELVEYINQNDSSLTLFNHILKSNELYALTLTSSGWECYSFLTINETIKTFYINSPWETMDEKYNYFNQYYQSNSDIDLSSYFNILINLRRCQRELVKYLLINQLNKYCSMLESNPFNIYTYMMTNMNSFNDQHNYYEIIRETVVKDCNLTQIKLKIIQYANHLKNTLLYL